MLHSLLRTGDVDHARIIFDNFKAKLPPLLAIDPDLCAVSSLQQLCDALRKNPTLSVAHLAVMFDLRKVAADASVAE